jgi:hypothetical protein
MSNVAVHLESAAVAKASDAADSELYRLLRRHGCHRPGTGGRQPAHQHAHTIRLHCIHMCIHTLRRWSVATTTSTTTTTTANMAYSQNIIA